MTNYTSIFQIRCTENQDKLEKHEPSHFIFEQEFLKHFLILSSTGTEKEQLLKQLFFFNFLCGERDLNPYDLKRSQDP